MDLSWLSLAARAALLALVAAALLRALVLRLRARREAARARESLGAPRRHLEGLAEGDQVTLIGTLEPIGPLCRRFEDGALVAAATAQASGNAAPVSARAERLELAIDDRAVEILGPVEVVVGAREEWPNVALSRLSIAVRHRVVEAGEEAGADPDLRGRVTLRSLRSGDRVRARGVLRRASMAPSGHGYREQAAPWTLAADPTVLLAFEGSPRVRGPLRALASGLRDTRRFAVAAVAIGLLGLVVTALNTVQWSEGTVVLVPPQATRPRPKFADANQCVRHRARYEAARDQANRCAQDEECAGEIRGEQWFELDGCFRFHNAQASMAPADTLATAWFEDGCSTQYEVCSIVPQAMCRRGQCVERPPHPVPEDWTRQDIAHLFTFFTPRGVQRVHGGGNCTGGLSYSFEGPGMSIYFDYDSDTSVEAPSPSRDAKIGQERVKLATFEKDDPFTMGTARFGVVAFFPDVPRCPPLMCFGWSGKGAMKVTAYCQTRADAEIAMASLQSIRRW